jgi:coproporphyrinogen III oxidase-like Fe-S oxidoreductase
MTPYNQIIKEATKRLRKCGCNSINLDMLDRLSNDELAENIDELVETVVETTLMQRDAEVQQRYGLSAQ